MCLMSDAAAAADAAGRKPFVVRTHITLRHFNLLAAATALGKSKE
jgi:hypothetical protein